MMNRRDALLASINAWAKDARLYMTAEPFSASSIEVTLFFKRDYLALERKAQANGFIVSPVDASTWTRFTIDNGVRVIVEEAN